LAYRQDWTTLAVVGSRVVWMMILLGTLTFGISSWILMEPAQLVTFQLAHALSVRISVRRF
jgi:hypothetical protein